MAMITELKMNAMTTLVRTDLAGAGGDLGGHCGGLTESSTASVM